MRSRPRCVTPSRAEQSGSMPVKHLVLCRIERRPPRLDMTVYPYSPEGLLDRLTHHVHILELNGNSYRLNQSKRRSRRDSSDTPTDNPTQA